MGMGRCAHAFDYKEVVFSDVSGIQNVMLFCTFKYSIIFGNICKAINDNKCYSFIHVKYCNACSLAEKSKPTKLD